MKPTRADRFASQNARGHLRYRESQARLSIGMFNGIVGQVRAAARRKGYALAVHGSLLRDIDLLAVPWVPRAAGPRGLLREIVKTLERTKTAGTVFVPRKQPTVKPHGRLAWSIHLGFGQYIDLSVMPRPSR